MNRLASLVALVLTACSLGLERDPPDQARFLIQARRTGTPPGPDAAGVRLEVRAFHAASAFASIRFVYRTDEDRWEDDFYRQFLVRPELAIGDAARTWLTEAGIAGAVLAPGSSVAPTHTLEADVVALYGDFRDRTAPRAILELRVVLLDRLAGAALGQWSYAEEEPLGGTDPDLLPAAWNVALARALERLEADLRAAL